MGVRSFIIIIIYTNKVALGVSPALNHTLQQTEQHHGNVFVDTKKETIAKRHETNPFSDVIALHMHH